MTIWSKHTGITSLIAALTVSMIIGGCVAATVGVAVTGVDVVYDRRTVGNYVDDNVVENKIRYDIRSDDALDSANVSVTSMNGIVLLSGQVPSGKLSERAASYASAYEEVRQVINQLEVEGRSGFSSRMNDTWLTTKVKTALLTADIMESQRYKVVTEDSTVYLMGLVTRAEADQAVAVVQTVTGVQKIVKVFEYIG